MTQTLTPQAFDALVAEGYSRIPVTRTLLADTETPLSTYTKLCDEALFLSLRVSGGG
jgi:anthranilate synthase component 1